MTTAFSVRRNGGYQGTGANKDFAITFPFDVASEITVIRFDQTTGLPTLLAQPADYTVSIPNSEVNLVPFLGATEEIVVLGRSVLAQLSNIPLGELTASELVQTIVDFGVRLQQEALELAGRGLVVDETVSSTVYFNGTLPVGVRITGVEALVVTDVVKLTVKSILPHVWEATKA